MFHVRKGIDYRSLLGDNNPLKHYPKLKEAAVDEFSRKRFEDASLNDILKKAGMSKGSLYHNFGDKFGLYLAMMDIILKEKAAYFGSLLRQEVDFYDFFATLTEIVKSNLSFMLADERMHHLSNRVMEESEEFRNRLYSFFADDYNELFSAYIELAKEARQIDSRYPTEFVARVIEIMVANLDKLILTRDPDGVTNTANLVIDLVRHGISGEQASDKV